MQWSSNWCSNPPKKRQGSFQWSAFLILKSPIRKKESDRVRRSTVMSPKSTWSAFFVAATPKSSDLMEKNGAHPRILIASHLLKKTLCERKKKPKSSSTAKATPSVSSFIRLSKILDSKRQRNFVRPSSKGTIHLTVTWKVGENICQHVDVREEGKENAFSLGQSLWINDEEFEDLDEIVARYINPMAGHARDLYAFRYFRDLGIPEENYALGKERERADEVIKDDRKKNPAKMHYFVTASRQFLGKLMLTYLPRTHTKHEFITVTPKGFRFRGQVHDSLATLFRWFKEHFRDPFPGTPINSSRGGGHHTSSSSFRTPGYGGTGTTPNANPDTLQRVGQSIPSLILQSFSQAAHSKVRPVYLTEIISDLSFIYFLYFK